MQTQLHGSRGSTDLAVAPGRHFVTRGLQRCRAAAEFGKHLRRHASAGGFAFSVGELGSGKLLQVETAAGHFAERQPSGCATCSATPTTCVIFGSGARRTVQNSHSRARIAADWVPDWGAPVEWCLRVLARERSPRGVRRDVAGDDSGVTVVNMVCDLIAGEVVIALRDRDPVAIPARDLARGDARRQRPCETAGVVSSRAEHTR